MTDTTTTTAAANKPRRQTASAPPHPPNHASSSSSPRPQQFLSYMHRPPRIMPNYGKRPRGVLPKSSVSRVLLYDNVTQQQMLDVKMTYLENEQLKTGRLMDMHRKSFLTRRLQKERQMAETALHVDHHLLEQGLLSSTNPRHADHHHHHHHQHKTRAESNRAFNPYLAPENNNHASPTTSYDVTDAHVTWDPTNDVATAEDSPPPPQNGDVSGEEMSSSVQLLSVDRQRAVTSDCLTLPHSLPAKPGSHRAAQTAQLLKGQGDSLPSIHAASSGHPSPALNGKVTMDTQQQSGFTRILHTFHDSWEGGGGGEVGFGTARRKGGNAARGGKRRTMEDERYRMLERMLVRIEPPNEGYLELSPSFHTPRQPMTFTRPSSLHPSLLRRRSASSSSSRSSSSSSSRAYSRSFSIQI